MRNISGSLMAIVFLILMAGNASAGPLYTWQNIDLQVGPAAPKPASAYLKVYTEAHLYYDQGVQREDRLPYAIFSADGKKIKEVFFNDRDPKLVTLPPGKYVIVPQTVRTKTEIVGAVLKPGRITEVHLKGENPI